MDAKTVKIGNKLVGDGQPVYIVAEIGINHNGDIDLAKRLISVAVAAGCDAVKFQKRTVDVVYTARRTGQTARESIRHDQWRPEARPGIRLRRIPGDRRLLPSGQNRLVRLLLGRGVRRFHRSVRRAVLQDRLGLAHRRQSAAPHPGQRQADHHVDRDEHDRRDRPRRRGARAQKDLVSCTRAAPIRPITRN